MPVPTQTLPYIWRCMRTQYSNTGWQFESVELIDTYNAALRLLTEKEWPTGSNTMRVYQGKPGEPYKDMFLSTAGGGVFYECIRSGIVRGEVSNPNISVSQMTPDRMTGVADGTVDDTESSPSEPTAWKTGTFWPSFSTSLLVALRAYIEELYVNRLFTVSQDGIGIRIEEGMIRIFDERSDQWACFGVETSGTGNTNRVLKLQFWKGDELQIDYGPSSVFSQIDKQDSSWALIQLASWGNSAPAVNDVFPLTTQSVTSYYRFAEGWKKVNNTYKYLVSGGNSPNGALDKHVFTQKTASTSYYIPNGYYRKQALYGHEYLQEAQDYADPVVNNQNPTGSTAVAICMMQVYYYSSGTLTVTYEVKFQRLSDGKRGKVISVTQRSL